MAGCHPVPCVCEGTGRCLLVTGSEMRSAAGMAGCHLVHCLSGGTRCCLLVMRECEVCRWHAWLDVTQSTAFVKAPDAVCL
eukprot:1162118-Pelagomonas_calceolata.AAC.3